MFLKNMYLKHKKRKEFIDSIHKLKINKNIESYKELCSFYDKLKDFVSSNKDYLINISDNMPRSQRIELRKYFDSVVIDFIDATKKSTGALKKIVESDKISDESKQKTIKYMESHINTAISATELMNTIHNVLSE